MMKEMEKSNRRKFGGLRAAVTPLFLLLAVCLAGIRAEAKDGVWTGSGEYDDPYLIEDTADFLEFREYVNAGRADEDQYFLLKNDLDLAALCGKNIGSWTPIGSNS
ncbi:MAG: hypothetical protein J5898_02530, partial [Lachnospiraceae bacterium]|nr:hypothetical protein [Lachnospiraceae bacterium]